MTASIEVSANGRTKFAALLVNATKYPQMELLSSPLNRKYLRALTLAQIIENYIAALLSQSGYVAKKGDF